MDKKFAMSETVWKELEQKVESLEKALADKEKEIKDGKDQLHQAKEAAVHEYRDSDALLEELGTSYANDFDNAIHQAKKTYHQLNIDTQAQATAQPITFESTKDLFADDATLGDGESVPIVNQAQLVDGDAHLPMNVEENVENTASPQQFFFFVFGEIVTILGTTYFNFVRCLWHV